MNTRIENAVIHDQEGLVGAGYEVENQYLKLIAVDGEFGTFYQLDTKGGKWSFSEVEEITKLLESFVSISNGLR